MKKVIYILKFLERLKIYKRRYSINIKNKSTHSWKKCQKKFYLYIKYEISKLNLN